MSRTPARITQADVADPSVVYIVRIGKHVKIGFSRNLENRLKAFQTSAVDIELLLSIPGGRDLEAMLHDLLSESKINREMFHRDWRVCHFIDAVENGGLEHGLNFLENSTPQRREAKRKQEREERAKQARMNRAEKDAYFAALVAQRKERLGW